MKTALLLLVVCVAIATAAGVYHAADHSAPACLCEAPDVPVCDVNGGQHNPKCIEGCYHDEIDSDVKIYDSKTSACVDA